jgi:ribA/ribD-fused uncharacterized protein
VGGASAADIEGRRRSTEHENRERIEPMWTKERLVATVAAGAAHDYLFFWGHTPKGDDVVDAACLSQWFPRAFDVGGVRYATAEHFMMAGKARLFGDDAARAEILAAKTPSEAKALGRAVRGFDEERWREARGEIVVRGSLGKFGEHADLREYLLSTGDKVLVEASPRDTVWGIGMGASNPAARDPSRWRGTNLLGFALMETRARLREARAD